MRFIHIESLSDVITQPAQKHKEHHDHTPQKIAQIKLASTQ